MTKERCSESVRNTSGWGNHRCERTATVDRDGKPYCAQHDPEKRQVTLDRQRRKFEQNSRLAPLSAHHAGAAHRPDAGEAQHHSDRLG